MKESFLGRIATISFAIFAMLFGAGNLIFPLHIGMESGQHTFIGFLGFAFTGVVLPVLGLIAMVTFDGDYKKFFCRVDERIGKFLIFLSLLVIGPCIAMPRIVTLSYEMLVPFLPTSFVVMDNAMLWFAFIFVAVVYLVTSRPGKLLDIIGKFLSPAMVCGLTVFIIAGLMKGINPEAVTTSTSAIFINSFRVGYGTLDILGAIFFSSMIVTLLSKYSSKDERVSKHQAAITAGIAGTFAGLLLGGVYLGVTYLAAFNGAGLEHLNLGAVFAQISHKVLGIHGAAIISAIVLLAGFTTIVALAAVLGEYVQVSLGKRVSYLQGVGGVLLATAWIASHGLETILQYAGIFTEFFYPIIIVITLCNLAYKLFGFKYIKTPVAATALVLAVMHFMA